MKKQYCALVLLWAVGSFGAMPSAPTDLMVELLPSVQEIHITDTSPDFSWVVNDRDADEIQTAYQVLVASSLSLIQANIGDVWDSGTISSRQSSAVEYGGTPLPISSTFYWKVRTWDKDGNLSPYSKEQEFKVVDENSGFTLENAEISNGNLELNNRAYVESVNGSGWGDYTLEADVVIDDVAVGINFRVQNSDNYYMWQLNAGSGKFRPHLHQNGSFSVLKEVPYSFSEGTTYAVRIEAVGNTIKTYINSVLVDTLTDNTFSGGRIGFRLGSGETGSIEWVTVTDGSTELLSETFDSISAVDRLEVEAEYVYPVEVINKGGGKYFIDFGRAAFGRPVLTLTGNAGDEVNVKIGEVRNGNSVDTSPPNSNVVYYQRDITLQQGTRSYWVGMPKQNQGQGDRIFHTLPFRYCELSGVSGTLSETDARQQAVFIPFDEDAAFFSSDDSTLNEVWELCKYTMKATSWLGIYVDGNRERKPYEADAYIQQLGHYSVDKYAYAMGRYSMEYLLFNTTWPTEWTPHMVLMAYEDWMWTGDTDAIDTYYNDIKAKTQHALTESNDLISTRTGKKTSSYLSSIHYSGSSSSYKDIVDWPSGERDGFVFKDYNTVVNALHHGAIDRFADMAQAVGNTSDYDSFTTRTANHRTAVKNSFWNSSGSRYKDGIGTSHSALHSTAFSVAFGLLDPWRRDDVAAYLSTRDMDVSVYGAQYYMEALYEVGAEQHALDLLRSTASRSWYNMIREGSTVAMEAWGQAYKSNQDWNHAWGAAPANIIPRHLMGIKPLLPAFERIQIKPQVADLDRASVRMPTIRGSIFASVMKSPTAFTLYIDIPANTTAEVYVPQYGISGDVVRVDGEEQSGDLVDGFVKFDNVGSGRHWFERGDGNTGAPSGFVYVGPENGSFTFSGYADCAYGANGQFSYLREQSGTVTFDNDTFGDPIHGVAKQGYFKPVPTGPEGYQQWIQTYGIENRPHEDGDGDNLSNLHEYYLGSSPTNAASPETVFTWTSQHNSIIHTYNSAAADVYGWVKWNNDLLSSTWSTSQLSHSTNATTGRIRSILGTLSTNKHLFIRLEVDY